jgi:hypothetical protein
MARREQSRQRAALGDPEDRRAVKTRSIHDRANIVHPLLERRRARDRVRHPRSPLIEHHDARERPQPAVEIGHQRLLPNHFQMTCEPRHHDQLNRPGAKHLIGDMHLTAPGIPRLGNLGH